MDDKERIKRLEGMVLLLIGALRLDGTLSRAANSMLVHVEKDVGKDAYAPDSKSARAA